MRIELVTPCKHGFDDHKWNSMIYCLDEARSTVSGFSPEAVQAAAKAHMVAQGWSDDPNEYELEYMTAALAAAWATDYGGEG